MGDRQGLPSTLLADLTAALKRRDHVTVSTLRSAIAALDNAEAVAAPPAPGGLASAHVAGAQAGVASTDAPRRAMSDGQARAVLQAQVDEAAAAAAAVEAHGQPERAPRLRREAQMLQQYVRRSPEAE